MTFRFYIKVNATSVPKKKEEKQTSEPSSDDEPKSKVTANPKNKEQSTKVNLEDNRINDKKEKLTPLNIKVSNHSN